MKKQPKTVWVCTRTGEKLGIAGDFVTAIYTNQIDAQAHHVATGDGYGNVFDGLYSVGQFLPDVVEQHKPVPLAHPLQMLRDIGAV